MFNKLDIFLKWTSYSRFSRVNALWGLYSCLMLSVNFIRYRTISPLTLDGNYINMKNQVIKAERRILKELGFCVHVKHPHKVGYMFHLLHMYVLVYIADCCQEIWLVAMCHLQAVYPIGAPQTMNKYREDQYWKYCTGSAQKLIPHCLSVVEHQL